MKIGYVFLDIILILFLFSILVSLYIVRRDVRKTKNASIDIDLRQYIPNNDEYYRFIEEAKKNSKDNSPISCLSYEEFMEKGLVLLCEERILINDSICDWEG